MLLRSQITALSDADLSIARARYAKLLRRERARGRVRHHSYDLSIHLATAETLRRIDAELARRAEPVREAA